MLQRIREMYQENGTRGVAANVCQSGYFNVLSNLDQKALKSGYVTAMRHAGREIGRAFVKINAEREESAIINDLMTTNLNYLEGIVELHPDKLDVPPSEVVDELETACSQCEFLAETLPQCEFSRPMYHFVRKKSDFE